MSLSTMVVILRAVDSIVTASPMAIKPTTVANHSADLSHKRPSLLKNSRPASARGVGGRDQHRFGQGLCPWARLSVSPMRSAEILGDFFNRLGRFCDMQAEFGRGGIGGASQFVAFRTGRSVPRAATMCPVA